MCKSVPQIEAARTRTSTSFGPIVGMETASSCAPRSGRIFRKAFIVAVGIRKPCDEPVEPSGGRGRKSDVNTRHTTPEAATKPGGALADRLGFRRALSLAYAILSCAYFLLGSISASWMGPVREAVPLLWLVVFVLMLPALGIALVKPCVVGTTARASSENVRSIGYSIYYTLVNIGGAAGPYLASWVHRHLSVENVFRLSALSVFLMFFAVL